MAPWAALIAQVLASLVLVGWLLLLCRSGFDQTDEGFYLNWISAPTNYRFSVSQFGFVYYPLYELVGGDISRLRVANLVVSFGLGWLLSFVMMQSAFKPWSSASRSTRAAVVACAFSTSVASLSFLALWQPTPNYNSLAFQSMIIAAIGLVLTRQAGRPMFGWLFIGVGGGLAFLAKPTTAAALALIVLLYATIAGRLTPARLLVAACAAITLLVGAVWLIDASVWRFVDRIVGGFGMAQRLLPLQAGVLESFRWDFLHFSSELWARFKYLLVAYLVLSTMSVLFDRPGRASAALIMLLSAGLSTLVLLGLVSNGISDEPAEPFVFLAGAMGIATSAVLVRPRCLLRPSREMLAIMLAFFLLPFAFAIGTNTNGWMTAARAGFFWVLIGLANACTLSAARRDWYPLLCAASLSLVGTTAVVCLATEYPYRQPQPLRLQRTAVDLGLSQSQLLVSEETAALIRGLRRLAAEGGFKAGEPVLDLTGISPGLVYAIGGRPPGTPWTLGGYPGTVDFVTAGLAWEQCDSIAASWILSSPEAKDAISPDFLASFGIDVRTDYHEVGNIDTVLPFAPASRIKYQLLKPTRSLEVATSACERGRRE